MGLVDITVLTISNFKCHKAMPSRYSRHLPNSCWSGWQRLQCFLRLLSWSVIATELTSDYSCPCCSDRANSAICCCSVAVLRESMLFMSFDVVCERFGLLELPSPGTCGNQFRLVGFPRCGRPFRRYSKVRVKYGDYGVRAPGVLVYGYLA